MTQKLDTVKYVPKEWHCKEGTKKSALIPGQPCIRCTNQLMQVDCLEMLANTQGILYCLSCYNYYILEVRRKSLSECFRENTSLWTPKKTCTFISKILFLLFYISFVSFYIFYLFVSFDEWDFKSFIMMIPCLCLFLCYTFLILSSILDWNERIYEFYHQWHESIKEWKLIKQNHNVSIQGTEV